MGGVEALSERDEKAIDSTPALAPKHQTLKIEELDLTPIIPKNDFVQIENEINQKTESPTQQRKEDMKTLAQALKRVHERNKQNTFDMRISPNHQKSILATRIQDRRACTRTNHHVMLISLHHNLPKGTERTLGVEFSNLAFTVHHRQKDTTYAW